MEPYVEAERIAYEGEKPKPPYCLICGDSIPGDYCYIVDSPEADNCLCDECYRDLIDKIMVLVPDAECIEYIIDEAMDKHWQRTPTVDE